MRRKLVLLALMAGMLGLTPAASANIFHPPTAEGFSCRASALRVNALGGLVFSEPVVANKANDPCADDSASAVTASVPNLAQASVLSASTDSQANGSSSQASVANLVVTLGGTSIAASALSSQAAASCGAFHPQFSSSSNIATLAIGGKSYVVGSDPLTINVPTSGGLLSVVANERIQTSDQVTRRALRVSLLSFTGLGTTVVAGESIADVNGNPCA